MRQHIAELSAFVNRSRRLRRTVTPDAAGKGKLPEELPQPLDVLALFRIDLGVGSFEVSWTENARRAMPRTGQEDHVEIVLLDEPAQVNIYKRQPWAGSPVSQQTTLDMFRAQRFRQQRIIQQIDHAQAEVIASSPAGVGPAQLLSAERFFSNRRSGLAVGAERKDFVGGGRSEGAHKMTPGNRLCPEAA